MELPRRQRGDELLQLGEMTRLRGRLREMSKRHELTSVVACAFDHRTRMLPFFFADLRMAPGGVRAVGSALVDAGFERTRIVLQQWNKRFRPSEARLDGRIPDLFCVSSMQIHSAACHDLIKDACQIPADRRPLIIAGGAKTIYEPWDVFNADPAVSWGADVAVTGEEFVFLSLLERLLSMHNPQENLRKTFIRARNSGMLDDIPGLVYARGDREGVAEELVDTGVQRLLGDLDELPHPVLGFSILEPPSRRRGLGPQPLPASRVRRHSPIGALVLTFGCKFACSYCPIPAYNQRQHRVKSGERITDEFRRLYETFGMRFFFGADDNFFNDHQRTLDICERIAREEVNGRNIRHRIRWGTEVTVHDTLKMEPHLRTVRSAGVRALWLGVEDMTATFVRKGQSVDKTSESFRLLNERGICVMPMMMHHDEQPLRTPGSPYGLLDQVKLLRKAGAISMQVLMLSPATGSELYAGTFTDGMAYDSVGGKRVETHMLDANYVVASKHPKPWHKQFNLMLAYLYFYNPVRLFLSCVRPKTNLYLADAGMQVLGMWGLTQTVRRTFGWALRLRFGKISRRLQPPSSAIPMRSPAGTSADHALPGTPEPNLVPLNVAVTVQQ